MKNVLWLTSGDQNAPQQAAQEGAEQTAEPTAEPTGPATTFDDGTYRVGQDIAVGTYRASNPNGMCYWERTSGFSGGVEEVISNGFVDSGAAIVTIAETDAGFTSSNCGTWEPA